MSQQFEQNEALTELGERVHRQHHGRIEAAQILYLLMDPAPRKGGKTVLGKATALTGMKRYLAQREDGVDYEFVITISKEPWEFMSAEQREALLDHELAHLAYNEGKDGILKATTRLHDVEEFTDVLARRGAWRMDLEEFVAAAQQLQLPLAPAQSHI